MKEITRQTKHRNPIKKTHKSLYSFKRKINQYHYLPHLIEFLIQADLDGNGITFDREKLLTV